MERPQRDKENFHSKAGPNSVCHSVYRTVRYIVQYNIMYHLSRILHNDIPAFEKVAFAGQLQRALAEKLATHGPFPILLLDK